MNARWTPLLIAVFVAGWVATARADDASVQKEVQATCDKIVAALKSKDAKSVLSHYAADYMGKRLDGTTVTREQLQSQLEQQLGAVKVFKQVSLKIDKVASSGSEATGTATINLALTITGDDGADHEVTSKRTSKQTWTKTDTGWKLKRSEELTQEQTVDGQPGN
jgi:ketosteroid isomerase-like protein